MISVYARYGLCVCHRVSLANIKQIATPVLYLIAQRKPGKCNDKSNHAWRNEILQIS